MKKSFCLTDRVRIVLKLARDAAQSQGSDHILPEHILIGLIEEGSGIAANILRTVLQIGPWPPRSFDEEWIILGENEQYILPEETKTLFHRAKHEAITLWQHFSQAPPVYALGTEHLLLALCADDRIRAAKLLEAQLAKVGLTLEDLRQKVIAFVLGISKD